MKIKLNLYLFFLFIPLFTYGQINKFLKVEKAETKNQINKIVIEGNDEKYKKTQGTNRRDKAEKYNLRTTGYREDVEVDFFKEATKTVINSEVNYSLCFELQRGISFSLEIDSFNIPSGTFLEVRDSNGMVLEKIPYDKQFRIINNRKFLLISSDFNKNILLTITMPNKFLKKENKILVSAIIVRIDERADISSNADSN